jgi:hypothetical protein
VIVWKWRLSIQSGPPGALPSVSPVLRGDIQPLLRPRRQCRRSRRPRPSKESSPAPPGTQPGDPSVSRRCIASCLSSTTAASSARIRSDDGGGAHIHCATDRAARQAEHREQRFDDLDQQLGRSIPIVTLRLASEMRRIDDTRAVRLEPIYLWLVETPIRSVLGVTNP